MITALRKHAHKLQTVLLLMAVFAAGFAFGNMNTISEAQTRLSDTDEAFEPFWEAFSTIQTRYVDGPQIEIPTLVNGAISGMVDSLGDQYSGYLEPQDYAMFNSDISGDVEGIGVVIRTNEESGAIEVINVLEGAPARAAGVLPGDIFHEVNGEMVAGMNQTELASKVRGPAGTTVNIIFERDGELLEFEITRARFEVPNVETDILENDIAYISFAEFNSLGSRQLNDAIRRLNINERTALILDIRGNPGGLLNVAVDVASLFVRDGVILYETFSDGSEQVFRANGNYAGIEVPIVLLIDETSASASELLAGALKDRGIATLIGETTFGKGTVQTIQPLSNGGGLRLTVARWLTPNRGWIHDQGIVPDIEVDWDPESFAEMEGDDPQLQAAIEYINGLE